MNNPTHGSEIPPHGGQFGEEVRVCAESFLDEPVDTLVEGVDHGEESARQDVGEACNQLIDSTERELRALLYLRPQRLERRRRESPHRH